PLQEAEADHAGRRRPAKGLRLPGRHVDRVAHHDPAVAAYSVARALHETEALKAVLSNRCHYGGGERAAQDHPDKHPRKSSRTHCSLPDALPFRDAALRGKDYKTP